MVEAKKKYIVDSSDLSSEVLNAFVKKVNEGIIKPFLKSAPIPTE